MESREVLTVNLGGKAREVFESGKRWLVAPAAILIHGVLNGSKGPLYYPPDESQKTAHLWDRVPITINHPFDPTSGEPLNFKDRGVKERQWIGETRNPTWDGKTRVEAWFDADATSNKSKPVYDALIKGEQIDLSTGLHTSNEELHGHHEGTPYVAIARDHRPDHLAILPNQRGACSVSDGCGVGVTNADTTDNEWSDAARDASLAARRATHEAHAHTLKSEHAGATQHSADAKLSTAKIVSDIAGGATATSKDKAAGHQEASKYHKKAMDEHVSAGHMREAKMHRAASKMHEAAASAHHADGTEATTKNSVDAVENASKLTIWQKLGQLLFNFTGETTTNTPNHPLTGQFTSPNGMPHAHATHGWASAHPAPNVTEAATDAALGNPDDDDLTDEDVDEFGVPIKDDTYNAWGPEAREAALAARQKMKEASATHEGAKKELADLQAKHAALTEKHGAAVGAHAEGKEHLQSEHASAKDKAEAAFSAHDEHTSAANDSLGEVASLTDSPNKEHAELARKYNELEEKMGDHYRGSGDMKPNELVQSARANHKMAKELHKHNSSLKADDSHEDNLTDDNIKENHKVLGDVVKSTRAALTAAKEHLEHRRTMHEIRKIATNAHGEEWAVQNCQETTNSKGDKTVKTPNKLSDNERKAIVDTLVSNCNCTTANVFEEADRGTLNAMTDAKLLRLKEQREAITNAFEKKKDDEEEDDKDSSVVERNQLNPTTLLATMNTVRKIDQLTAHITDAAIKERLVTNLSTKTDAELDDMLAIRGPAQAQQVSNASPLLPLFLGAGGGPVNNAAAPADDGKVNEAATLNFSKIDYAAIAEERRKKAV